MEISKDQIAIIKNCLGTTVTLVERLISGLECKTRLEDWQKKTLLQHRELLSKCNKSNWVLDCLHPVQVIPLEEEVIELLPPSSNSSVSNEEPDSNTEQCKVCKQMFLHLAAVDICQMCANAKEQEEIRQQRKMLIERTKAIQKEKDKRNTAISQMRKDERKGLKEQITLLETIGYDNLEREEKRSLTVYKARLAKMESDCLSVD